MESMLLKKFDPFRMPDDLVRAVSTARDDLVADIMRIVSENLAARDTPMQHLAIAAPRGTGKTFLLRLIGLEVEDRRQAGQSVAFLHMPEEQPDLFAPSSLLQDILIRLTNGRPEDNDIKWRPADDWNRLTRAIDTALADRFGANQGLLVLCLENIQDLIANAIPTAVDQRRLRAWLVRPDGRIMLIAASAAGPFDSDYDKPLFHVARTIRLPGWDLDETIAFLDKVMRVRQGIPLSDDGRAKARAIAAFTGGSPRMAAALADIITAENVMTAAQTLDALVDNLQEYYLGRLRDMGAHARRCIGKLLRTGENISQSELARRLGEQQSLVAQTFRALIERDILVGFRPPGSRETLYRVADRVFVHFYRMRILHHGQDGSVLAPILELLISAFTDAQRASEASRLYRVGLAREARVLLDTLPKLDPSTADEFWWVYLRGFVDWVLRFARRWDWGDDPSVDQLRELQAQPAKATSIAESLAQTTDDPARSPLRTIVAGIAYLASGYADAALNQFQSDNPPDIRVRALSLLGAAIGHAAKREWTSAGSHSEAAVRLCEDQTDLALLSSALQQQGFYAYQLGQQTASETAYHRAAELPAISQDDASLSSALSGLAYWSQWHGRSDDALKLQNQAYTAAVRSGDPRAQARRGTELSNIFFSLGNMPQALRLAKEAVAHARHSNDPYVLIEATQSHADALNGSGLANAAIELTREMVTALNAAGGPFIGAYAYASMAFILAHSEFDLPANVATEAIDFADKALALSNENQVPSKARLLALQAKMQALESRHAYEPCLEVALLLEQAARAAANEYLVGCALDSIVFALVGLHRYQDATTRAASALGELASHRHPDMARQRNILTNAVLAFRVQGRLRDIEPVGRFLLRQAMERSDTHQVRHLTAILLPVAVDAGLFAWSLDLARQILTATNEPLPAAPPRDIAVAIIAAITAAAAWPDMQALVTNEIWDAAAPFAGQTVARALASLATENGRAAAFAAFNSLLLQVARDVSDTEPTSAAPANILRFILTSHPLTGWPSGLITDIADAVTHHLPGRFDHEIHVLREVARFIDADRDPTMLDRLDPDVARMLRLIDPGLIKPQPAGKPPAKRKRIANKRKPPPKRR